MEYWIILSGGLVVDFDWIECVIWIVGDVVNY